jgi:hypothetical protein
VIWRNPGCGTDGEEGSTIVERLLMLVVVCRQRCRQVLGFLTACLDERPAPTRLGSFSKATAKPQYQRDSMHQQLTKFFIYSTTHFLISARKVRQFLSVLFDLRSNSTASISTSSRKSASHKVRGSMG